MGIANIINNSTTTSGGEIVRELVNSSDGQGLHFDGSAGAINLGSSMPDLGEKYSLEFVVKGDARTGEVYLLDAYNSSSTNRVILAWSGNSNGNIQLHVNGTWSSAFIATPDNGEVLHLLLSVDGTSATLYQNGNSVSTQTVVANTLSGATNTHIGASQNGSGNFFNGTIYRARFYNRTLSADDVRTAFERSDVPVADQYGSASNKITNGNFETNTSGWTSENTSTFQRNTTSPISGTGDLEWTGDGSGYPGAISNSFSLTAGKKYRIKFTYRVTSGTVYLKFGKTAAAASAAVAGISEVALTASSNTAYEATITPTETTTAYIVFRGNNNTTPTMFVDLVDFVQIGCVSDYDLAFANENQSRMVADRSTNNVDGEMSSSGVKQTQVIKQLNSTAMRIGGTSATAATPADGEVVANVVKSVDGSDYIKIDADTGQVAMYRTGNYIDFLKSGSTFKIRGPGYTDYLTIDSTGLATFSAGDALAVVSNRTTGDGDAIHVRKDNYTRLRLGTLGITFPNGGTAPVAAANNQLDYYGEGDWTPSVGGDATYSVQTGRYTRVGRLVTATWDMTISAIGTGSTYIVSGLPFNSGASIGAGGSIIYYSSLATAPVLFAPTVGGSTVHIRSATSAATSPSNHSILGNGSRIAGIVTYTV